MSDKSDLKLAHKFAALLAPAGRRIRQISLKGNDHYGPDTLENNADSMCGNCYDLALCVCVQRQSAQKTPLPHYSQTIPVLSRDLPPIVEFIADQLEFICRVDPDRMNMLTAVSRVPAHAVIIVNSSLFPALLAFVQRLENRNEKPMHARTGTGTGQFIQQSILLMDDCLRALIDDKPKHPWPLVPNGRQLLAKMFGVVSAEAKADKKEQTDKEKETADSEQFGVCAQLLLAVMNASCPVIRESDGLSSAMQVIRFV